MDVKYLNPIFSSLRDVVTQVLGSQPLFAKPSLKESPFSTDELSIIIGITGEMDGKAIINISKENCVEIASRMMGGMEMQFNDLSKSAVGELFNMVMGTAVTYFAQEGIQINITSPTFLENNKILIGQKERIISVPMSIERIKMIVNISAEINAI